MSVQSNSKTIETGFELKGPGVFLPVFLWKKYPIPTKVLEIPTNPPIIPTKSPKIPTNPLRPLLFSYLIIILAYNSLE